jgi:rubrerythrin
MKSHKLDQFAELLQQQNDGDAEVIHALRKLQPQLEDGYCLYNLYEQWAKAFAYQPGRLEALSPILNLALKLKQQSSDDTLTMYREPEWASLVALRGPVETVQFYMCSECAHEHPRMATSGFLDEADWICRQCSSVLFKSFYDSSPAPRCDCGGSFQQQGSSCPFCGSNQISLARYISPFEYFERHRFVRESAK